MAASFDFDGAAVPVRPGDTVATALMRAGRIAQRVTRGDNPRGLFCGMGVCHDCLVVIDGRAAQRACMTPADGVQRVMPHREARSAAPLEPLAPAPGVGALPVEEVDLAIVGAGPAGMAAALAAQGRGVSLCLIDERKRPGGQYFKSVSPGVRSPADPQHRKGEALRARIDAAGIPLAAGTTVWHARAEGDAFELGLYDGSAARLLRVRAVILATGAYERPPAVPGWTLPGAMTVGAAQGLVRSFGVAPGKRVVIAGQGPLGLQLAVEMLRAGCPPVAVLERARPTRPGALGALAAATAADPGLIARGVAMRARLLAARVPVWEGWEVAAVTGTDRVAGLEVRRLHDGARKTLAADAVCLGEGLLPQAELARALGVPCRQDEATGFLVPERAVDGATAKPGIWIAGDGGGMGGAQAALAQGELAAAAALAFLGATPRGTSAARQALARAGRFQAALWRLYDAPPRLDPPPDDTVLCRCEGVTMGQARAALERGAGDLGALKRMTRLGMGRCQGRYCAGPAALLTGSPALFAPQVPLRPVPAAAVALEKPEWGGHRRVPTPALRAPDPRRAAAPPVLPARVDLAVIGAGIMGVSAAWRAALRGMDVVVLDRGGVNGESSGSNAGSLHMQLLSFDFGSKTVGRGAALLQTLPLQRDAIALWQAIEAELGADFEIRINGGLMLAEDEAQIGFLRDKVAAERSVGIEVEVIDRAGIAAIAPAVSERMIAAAWCPGEGKINPLLATPAVAAAARAAGARIVEGVQVTGLSAEGDGFVVRAGDRQVIARRLILAAGGWTGALGDMLGARLPVHGAPLQMVVTETAPPLAPCLLAHCDRHLTMKQAVAGNLIIGGAWSATTDPASGRGRVLRESLEGNVWVAQRVVPQVAGLHVLRAWAAMNVDIDGAPLVGPVPGVPGAVVVAGANGYTLGPLLGRYAADCAAGDAPDPAMARFLPDRFAVPA